RLQPSREDCLRITDDPYFLVAPPGISPGTLFRGFPGCIQLPTRTANAGHLCHRGHAPGWWSRGSAVTLMRERVRTEARSALDAGEAGGAGHQERVVYQR